MFDFFKVKAPHEYEINQNISQYLKTRFTETRNYYKKTSLEYKRLFVTFQILIIISAAVIPIINATSNGIWLGNILPPLLITSLLGGVVVILTAIVQLLKAQEFWLLYAATLDALESEYYMFSQKASKYSDNELSEGKSYDSSGLDKKRNDLFTKNIEDLILSKSRSFVQYWRQEGRTAK